MVSCANLNLKPKNVSICRTALRTQSTMEPAPTGAPIMKRPQKKSTFCPGHTSYKGFQRAVGSF
eukprot:CAMPEP_0198584378 /NCGR_PEP_ID=MMETSP1462-20131121/127947_1 /TAXON_ID=1333877 /ORGANISM="Brandtodinium nutriculum, Strain RCC3387" /LENGTH=63 /DNA_ID=CAMNT_0044315795 /DNA_START=40 /DNA_END=228 /DNA_ORIENTATION=+